MTVKSTIRLFGVRDAILQLGQINTGIANFIFIRKKSRSVRMKIFCNLGMSCLQDYLSMKGLNTTGRKIELVARAFAAFEIKLPIIASSEEEQKKLKLRYENQLQKFKICDPLSIEPS